MSTKPLSNAFALNVKCFLLAATLVSMIGGRSLPISTSRTLSQIEIFPRPFLNWMAFFLAIVLNQYITNPAVFLTQYLDHRPAQNWTRHPCGWTSTLSSPPSEGRFLVFQNAVRSQIETEMAMSWSRKLLDWIRILQAILVNYDLFVTVFPIWVLQKQFSMHLNFNATD